MEKQIAKDVLLPLLKSDYKMLKSIPADSVISGMKQDKKRIGAGLPLIMLNADHTLQKITDFTEEEAKENYLEFIETY